MEYQVINSMRALISMKERSSLGAEKLFAHEAEYSSAPEGISVIVPVHNGEAEMTELFVSLRNQSLEREKYEVIFALNGCVDNSRALVENFAETSGVRTVVLESSVGNVSRARNAALQHMRFRLGTFLDHDDHLSRRYLEECVRLGDYRSVVVSNIIKVEDNNLAEDYAQIVISKGFETSNIHGPDDITLCYRAYTLNAIKTAPAYMLRRVRYDESLPHCEDVKYWRDLFHAFTPITVKSPTRCDIYYRAVIKGSLSRKHSTFYEKAQPRIDIIDRIHKEAANFTCDSPQRKFDAPLKNLLMDTILSQL